MGSSSGTSLGRCVTSSPTWLCSPPPTCPIRAGVAQQALWGKGRGLGRGERRVCGLPSPPRPASHRACFVPPPPPHWPRQDAATIRSQYRDLLVSRGRAGSGADPPACTLGGPASLGSG